MFDWSSFNPTVSELDKKPNLTVSTVREADVQVDALVKG